MRRKITVDAVLARVYCWHITLMRSSRTRLRNRQGRRSRGVVQRRRVSQLCRLGRAAGCGIIGQQRTRPWRATSECAIAAKCRRFCAYPDPMQEGDNGSRSDVLNSDGFTAPGKRMRLTSTAKRESARSAFQCGSRRSHTNQFDISSKALSRAAKAASFSPRPAMDKRHPIGGLGSCGALSHSLTCRTYTIFFNLPRNVTNLSSAISPLGRQAPTFGCPCA